MRFLLVGFLTVFWICSTASAQSPFFERVDSIVTSYAEQELFSGTILVATENEMFKKGYGFANRSWDISNNVETRYQIGSLTQSFTAALILQLIEQGNISLDDPLAMHLPEFPAEYGVDVTLRQLLSHTSGIPDYTTFEDWQDTTSQINVAPMFFINRIAEKDLLFPPGTDFSFSNSNYFLLGLVVEKITGMSYSRVLQENILDPSGMTNTGYLFEKEIVERLAEGYERLGEGIYEKASHQNFSTTFAANGIYSTVDDLYLWDQLFYDNQALSEHVRTQMTTANENNFSYGWVIGEVSPSRLPEFLESPFTFESRDNVENNESYELVWRRGYLPGFNSLILRVPASGWSMIILENQELSGDPEGTNIIEIAAELFNFLHEE